MIHYYLDGFHRAGATLSMNSPLLRSGFGIFETLFHNGRNLCNLDAHLERAWASLEEFGFSPAPLDYENLIEQLLRLNGLEGQPARVNIFYPARGGRHVAPVLTARSYAPKPDQVFFLGVCPEQREHTLAAHKVMDREFFNWARKEARARGHDETLLVGLGGEVLETTVHSLLFQKDGKFVQPGEGIRLPGTALALAAEVLEPRRKVVRVEDLAKYSACYVLNSLIGMKPVGRVGEISFETDPQTCQRLSALILG